MKKITGLAPTLTLTLLLGACTVGPDYVKPSVAPAATGDLLEAGRVPGVAAQAPLPDHWWELYTDPAVDRLVRDALKYNTDLRQAAANLARARAVVAEANSRRLPSTDLSATGARARQSGASGTGGTVDGDFFQAGFDAGYEIDLFGGVTRAVQAARGDADAAQAQLDAARVSVAAETTRAYVSACTYAAQILVARDTVRLQQQTVDLTQRLFDGGRGTLADLERAKSILGQYEAQLPTLEGERRAQLYALATLTGRPPEEIDATADGCAAPPNLTQAIPVGDGQALLARRPDVRAAERKLAADTARVGVAIADLYPKISLLGSLGFNAAKIDNAGSSSAFTYSFGPLISWSFPNQSAARARVRQAKATGDASLAAFDGAVLTALRETEQALARYGAALERNAALRRAEAASSKAADLSRKRFDYGADSFLQLISAEQERASARAALAQSDAALADAQVSLFKALGGGWQDAPPPERRADAQPQD